MKSTIHFYILFMVFVCFKNISQKIEKINTEIIVRYKNFILIKPSKSRSFRGSSWDRKNNICKDNCLAGEYSFSLHANRKVLF